MSALTAFNIFCCCSYFILANLINLNSHSAAGFSGIVRNGGDTRTGCRTDVSEGLKGLFTFQHFFQFC
ncbi:hypothetical protein XELAEV_18009291mg [Xenopus laevis]|uniref:Secreted protein n=1 Tax=Xenopus laevis TaxID=8355 RepID=A0A974I0E8_XENLA|nr:hypothetical protein XELAEV_18009291mg [Xenopus laevis]